MKRVFQLLLRFHVFFYRFTGGRFGSQVQGLQVLLLTSLGRKTNRKRTTPLGYFMDGDRYIITASNAGFDSHPAWFHTSDQESTHYDRSGTAEIAGRSKHC